MLALLNGPEEGAKKKVPSVVPSSLDQEARMGRVGTADIDRDIAGMDDTSGSWWSDPMEVVALARVLVEAGQLGGCQHTVITFFETPWAWDAEHQMWCAAGRPDIDAGSQFDVLCTRLRDVDDDRTSEHPWALRWQSWNASRTSPWTR